jgi:hypothetical protein
LSWDIIFLLGGRNSPTATLALTASNIITVRGLVNFRGCFYIQAFYIKSKSGKIPFSEEAVMETCSIKSNQPGLDYMDALELANEKAKAHLDDPMLLAWNDRDKGRFSPEVHCDIKGEDEPAWVVYARERGARLRVDVDDGAFTFIYI